ncbi:class C beta-lactamase [Jeongeupia naejangsanensis]|uniref:Beta-lactamase n=1 Tax=Jeongeupia naejangsanensis TaxID=613195 RepID=A0ABS2BMW3_9NEIS|nr:class C beta-lactamase [Jeongeupia naejangsanensis]MBM3116947.1 beta-lactamase [Jeongeupia naejangsanensis]
MAPTAEALLKKETSLTVLPKLLGLIAPVVAACLPFVAHAADDDARIRSIVDAAIRPVIQQYDVPGMAVAVIVDGKPRFFNYGVASRQDHTPVSENTLFELGSVSKTFTATLALYAQETGKLSLADHPGRYMPALAGYPVDKASLLELGTYSAGGLPLQFPDAVSDDAQMIDYFRQWKPDAEPGVLRRYSNPSIGLLGHVTAIALKSSFADAVETRLFPALGLNQSYVRVPQGEMARYAWGYDKTNKAIRVNPGMFDAEAYGIKSSAADMARFVQANIDPARLEGPMRRAVEGSHTGYFRIGEMVQGLGWEQYPYPVSLQRLQAGNSPEVSMKPNPAVKLTPPRKLSGATLFNKTGATNGFGAYVAFVPEEKIGIVMLANRNFPIPARIDAAHAILSRLAPGSTQR